jgi:hypothetical protein
MQNLETANTNPEVSPQEETTTQPDTAVLSAQPTPEPGASELQDDHTGQHVEESGADGTSPSATEEVIINPEEVVMIRQLVEKVVSSKFYMSNPKRVTALKEALAIPVSDDKSFQQFYVHAEKDLGNAAYKAARKSGTSPAEVTVAQIMGKAQEKYVAKHGKRAIVNEEYEG